MEVQRSQVRRQGDGDRESAQERTGGSAAVAHHDAGWPSADERAGGTTVKKGLKAGGSGFIAVLFALLAASAAAQTPDLTGVWAPYRGGRGADQRFAAPRARRMWRKAPSAPAFEAKRKPEAEAPAKGEPIASSAVA